MHIFMKKALPVLRKEQLIPFTPEGYQKLLAERVQLLADRPAAVEQLRKGREMGDLSENGYYKAARQQLSFLDGRIRRADRLIKLARIVHYSVSDTVQIGSTVVIKDELNQEQTLKVVGGYESNPLEHTISHVSPIGKALMGKRKGDIVRFTVPKGERKLTLISVT